MLLCVSLFSLLGRSESDCAPIPVGDYSYTEPVIASVNYTKVDQQATLLCRQIADVQYWIATGISEMTLTCRDVNGTSTWEPSPPDCILCPDVDDGGITQVQVFVLAYFIFAEVVICIIYHFYRHFKYYQDPNYPSERWNTQVYYVRLPLLAFTMTLSSTVFALASFSLAAYNILFSFLAAYMTYLLFLTIIRLTGGVETIYHFVVGFGQRHSKKSACFQCCTLCCLPTSTDDKGLTKNLFFRWEAGLFQFFLVRPSVYFIELVIEISGVHLPGLSIILAIVGMSSVITALSTLISISNVVTDDTAIKLLTEKSRRQFQAVRIFIMINNICKSTLAFFADDCGRLANMFDVKIGTDRLLYANVLTDLLQVALFMPVFLKVFNPSRFKKNREHFENMGIDISYAPMDKTWFEKDNDVSTVAKTADNQQSLLGEYAAESDSGYNMFSGPAGRHFFEAEKRPVMEVDVPRPPLYRAVLQVFDLMDVFPERRKMLKDLIDGLEAGTVRAGTFSKPAALPPRRPSLEVMTIFFVNNHCFISLRT
jgi:hypothetical protein